MQDSSEHIIYINKDSQKQLDHIKSTLPDFANSLNLESSNYFNFKRDSYRSYQCLVDTSGNIVALTFMRKLASRGEDLLKTLESLDLPHLKALSFMGLTVDPSDVISKFSTLEHLNLIRCKWGTDDFNLSKIKNLTKLELLGFTNSTINSLSGICNHKYLKTLHLGGTQIKCLKDLEHLKQLEILTCWQTKVDDLTPLANNHNLTHIYCQKTMVTSLDPLTSLKKLRVIHADNCEIQSISEDILKLDLPIKLNSRIEGPNLNKKLISLSNNPIFFPPKEILSRGSDVIKAYFNSLDGQIGMLNEAKLILVGEGSAGKTSLIRRFIDNSFDITEDKTDGISIRPWNVNAFKDEDKIKIHCWDFGGQEIMRATHQLFLSERSVYLIVLNIRKDENPEHWLKQVMAVSKSSPIIVVLNKCDEQFDDNLAKQTLKDKYPNICSFHKVSCLDNQGIEKLKKDVIKEISKLGMRKFIIAQNWLKVKQELEDLKVQSDYINYQKFIDICKKHSINSHMVQDILLTLLHDLGLIIHFKGLAELQTQVLNPKWITEGIYTLLNSDKLSQNHGIITKDEASKILNESYPCLKYRDKTPYVMKVMEQFELCYQVTANSPKERVEYLIPDLLPTELQRNPRLSNGIEFIYKYSGYMPPELMARFIVKSHTLQTPNKRWRYGVLLQSSHFDSEALVTIDKEEREIKIVVSGGEKRSFLGAIRSMFDEIHESYLTENIGLETFLPLQCKASGKRTLLPYQTLVKKQHRIWEGLEDDIQYDYNLEIDYSVSELLEGIESQQKHQENFVKNKGSIVNNINLNASPTINQSVNQDSKQSNEQYNSQSTEVSVSVQLKTFSSQLKDWGENIIDDLSDSEEVINNPELKKLVPRAIKEVERMDSALNDIDSVTDEAEAEEKLPKFAKVQTFIEDCINGTNKVGELIQKTGEGVGKLQSLGKEYNKIANKFGFQAIPTIFLGE